MFDLIACTVRVRKPGSSETITSVSVSVMTSKLNTLHVSLFFMSVLVQDKMPRQG